MVNFINALLVVVWLLRLVIGIQLFVTARRNNLPNLYWLSALFIINCIGFAFVDIEGNPLGFLPFSSWVINGFGLFANLVLIQFIHTTFYMNTVSPRRFFLGAHLALSALGIYGLTVSGQDRYSISPFVASFAISSAMVWMWHFVIARRSFLIISTDNAVEDWVKARYQMMVWYAGIGAASVFGNAIRIVFSSNTGILLMLIALVALLANIISVVLQFLVWVLPQGFRAWLNRNQQAHAEARLQKQALAIFDILCSAMSEGTGLSFMSAQVAIRKTLGQAIKTEDTAKITEHAIAMGYNEWQAFLKNRDLHLWIESLGTKGNPRLAIENALHALTEKQSLFTMQAK